MAIEVWTHNLHLLLLAATSTEDRLNARVQHLDLHLSIGCVIKMNVVLMW